MNIKQICAIHINYESPTTHCTIKIRSLFVSHNRVSVNAREKCRIVVTTQEILILVNATKDAV